MKQPADVARDAPDVAMQEALSDHHLDEVAEMIARWHADNLSPETPFSDFPAGSNHHP